MCIRDRYRASDWGISQSTEEGYTNPEEWLKKYQPEIDKKRNETKLWILKEAKRQYVEEERILNSTFSVAKESHLSRADGYHAGLDHLR